MSANIIIVNPNTGDRFSLDVTFTEAELTILREFATCAGELLDTEYFQLDRQASLSISWESNTGVKAEPYLPPKAVCDAMVFRLRPFVLQSEATFFNRVKNIIARRMQHPLVEKLLAAQCDLFEGKVFRAVMRVDDTFGALNDDTAVMQYLNAHEYHRDRGKRKRLEPACQLLQEDGLRAFYLMLLVEKARAIRDMAVLIEVLLGNKKEVTIRV